MSEIKIFNGQGNEEKIICSVETAKQITELLKRNTFAEVIKIEGVSSQACPVCHHNVNWRYCSNCGQRLKY